MTGTQVRSRRFFSRPCLPVSSVPRSRDSRFGPSLMVDDAKLCRERPSEKSSRYFFARSAPGAAPAQGFCTRATLALVAVSLDPDAHWSYPCRAQVEELLPGGAPPWFP